MHHPNRKDGEGRGVMEDVGWLAGWGMGGWTGFKDEVNKVVTKPFYYQHE